MAEPVVRCGTCGKPVNPHDDWCYFCGSWLSVDDIREQMEAELEPGASV